MPRLARSAAIETRESRSRLTRRHEPYWRTLYPGLALGYRKGVRGGTWVARKLEGQAYIKQVLGVADDIADADDDAILDFKQAHNKALVFGQSDRVRQRRSEPTVADIMDQYIDHHRAHYKSAEKTWSRIQCHVLPALGNRRVASLTTSEITRWHAAIALSKRQRRKRKDIIDVDPAITADQRVDPAEASRQRKVTANRALSVLKAALNFAYQQGVLEDDDAWRKVKPFRGVDAARVRFLTIAEAKRLIKATEEEFQPVVRAALLTGCRYGELTAAHVGDYLSEQKVFFVRYAKGGRPRHVPLTEEGVEFFDECTNARPGDEFLFKRANEEPWGASHQIRRMTTACKAAKISPPISFHDLRHTYASALAMKGVSLQVIAAALGHADTRITERHYAHMLPSYVAETIRGKLPRFSPKRRKSKTRPADVS